MVRLLALISIVAATYGGTAGDELTPSGSATPAKADIFRPPGSAAIPFETASQQLTGVFPFQLDKFEQVIQNSYNWQGPPDCSLSCQIGFTPEAVVVTGTMLDDLPLMQLHRQPHRPPWWRIAYGADGVELRIEDLTSASQALHFTLNFSSGGFTPQVQLLQSPGGGGVGFVQTAAVELAGLEGATTTNDTKPTGFRFRAVLPIAGLAEPKFFNGALRLIVRAHDLDGEFASYCMMEEAVEKLP